MAGKTCLINRFVRNAFCEDYLPTIEDSYRKVLSYEGEDYLLDITDTSGDPLYMSHTESLTRKGDGFLCLFPMDDVDAFQTALQFISKIELIKKDLNPTIMLVGTKCDEEVRRVSKQWADSHGVPYMESSSKLNRCVMHVFYTLVALLRQKKQANIDRQENHGQQDQENTNHHCCVIC